jgi:hypothetical protein
MRAKRIFHLSLFFTLTLDLAGLSLLSAVHGANEYPLDVSPPWLEVGTYVEYEICVIAMNAPKSILRWECVSLEDNIAVLNVSTKAGGYPGSPPISPRSAILRIKTDTREVIAENGSNMGKTYLWVPPFMKDGQEFLAEETESNGIVCRVESDGGSSVLTHCQGFQEVMWILSTQLGKLNIDCDVDRGIFVGGNIPSAVLDALNARNSIGGAFTIHDTNIDLGPVYWRTAVLTFLGQNLPWIILIALFPTALLLYRRRRRKQRARSTVMKKLGQI